MPHLANSFYYYWFTSQHTAWSLRTV